LYDWCPSKLTTDDKPAGLSDPFVVLELAGEKRESNVMPKTLNPEWEQLLFFALTEKPVDETLKISVYDQDLYSSDDPMGHCDLPLDFLRETEEEEREFTMKLKDVESGEIQLKVVYRKM